MFGVGTPVCLAWHSMQRGTEVVHVWGCSQLSNEMAESRAVGADPETGATLENPKGSKGESGVDVGTHTDHQGVPSPKKPVASSEGLLLGMKMAH